MSNAGYEDVRKIDMDYSNFQKLIKGKEKVNVDFKIRCEAFLSKKGAPKAELAKDICAMANNGNVASYIIIGVSDDARDFKSVSNAKLTDRNLQNFCKEVIFPVPKIKVHRCRWLKASSAHKGKIFIIIQVGPHAKYAFRLGKDFIFYPEKICYRRNSVWIRRGATTDLASPEGVAQLVKGLSPEGKSKPKNNVQYARLSKDKQKEAMTRDLRNCVEEIGGYLRIEKIGNGLYPNRVVIPIGKQKYVWRCILIGECTHKFGIEDVVNDYWQCEHGFLILAVGTVSKRAFPMYSEVNFKEEWGWFTYHFPSYYYFTEIFSGPKRCRIVTLTLPNIVDTDALRTSFYSMLQFLSADRASYDRLWLARKRINAVLKRWLRKKERGDRLEEKDLRKTAQSILRLSAGKLL